jgi:hypothetical protein
MFTRMISHTAYFDTFAKRKILGLAPEKYVVLADEPISAMPPTLNIGPA